MKHTPLHSSHLKLGAKMVPFAGYEMPVQYKGLLEETKATRTHGGLFDVSHMGQFSLTGNNTLEALQKLVTNDLSKLAIGQAQYNFLCNEKGGIIDDLVVYRRTENQTYICVNASNREADFNWMKKHLGSAVTLTDQSDETALIAVQGPLAEALLSKWIDKNILNQLKYYWAVDTTMLGFPIYLSRTGYTGEDGFEIYLNNQHAEKLWETLVEVGLKQGVVPCGLGARDTLRIEMGYPLHGHEISETITPLEAGLNWVVKLNLGFNFIGKDALLKQEATGIPRKLIALKINDRRIARSHYRILRPSGEACGEITSGTMSPHVGAPVAMGFINRQAFTDPELFVEIREAKIPAIISKLPFVPSKAKRNKPA